MTDLLLVIGGTWLTILCVALWIRQALREDITFDRPDVRLSERETQRLADTARMSDRGWREARP